MTIQSVNRAIDILFLFSVSRPHLGITEISRELNLTKPTVHGLVRTLADRGFLQQDAATKKYSLGLKIYELGVFLADTLKVNHLGAQVARSLAEKFRFVVRIAIWDQNSMLVTLNVIPGLKSSQFQQLGPRVPAYCSASGKAVLSTFAERDLLQYFQKTPLESVTEKTITSIRRLKEDILEAKRMGFARDSEEYMQGIACVSAPIFDHTGNSVAAISVSATPSLLFTEKEHAVSEETKQAASEISQALGHVYK